MDNRGQPLAIGRYFAVLVGIILIWIILSRPFEMVHNTALNMTTNETAITGLQHQKTLFGALPFIFVFVSGVGLVAIAVHQRRFA